MLHKSGVPRGKSFFSQDIGLSVGYFCLIAILISISACVMPENETPVSTVVDLRNKDSNGVSVSRAAANDLEFHWEFIEKDAGSRYGDITDVEIDSLISFEDDQEGFKVNFTNLERLRQYTLLMRIIYMDGNQNFSTRQEIHYSELNDLQIGGSVKNYSWVYPLVIPGKTCKFAIQFQYFTSDGTAPDFQLYYNVTPLHGIGIIDDMSSEAKNADHFRIDGTTVYIEDVIPVEAEGTIFKKFGIFTKDDNTSGQWQDMKWLEGYSEAISDEQGSATTIDLSRITSKSASKYFFFQFNYGYNIEGYDFCEFATPDFISSIHPNELFLAE